MTKISGLSLVAAFADTQEFGVNDSGISKKVTGAQLLAAVAQGTLAGGYAQVTANQGGITAITDLTSLTVTFTVVAGRRIRISAWVGLQSNTAADEGFVAITDPSNVIQAYAQVAFPSINNAHICAPVIVMTPAAGTYTYKLRAQRNSGSGTITMVADSQRPAFILAEDIGV